MVKKLDPENMTNDSVIIPYEYYASYYDKTPTLRKWPWGRIKKACQEINVYRYISEEQAKREKNQNACISFSILGKNHRTRANDHVDLITGIGLDLESKLEGVHPSIRQVRKVLKGYEYCGYTTHGHTPEAQRLRVFIPLIKPIHPDDFPPIIGYFAAQLPGCLDPAVKSLVQLAFVPKVPDIRKQYFEYFEGRGEFFNPKFILDDREKYPRIGKQKTKVKRKEYNEYLPIELPKVKLGDLKVSNQCKKRIVTGKAKKFQGDRSKLVFNVVAEILRSKSQLTIYQIAYILVNKKWGISERHHENSRNLVWVLNEICRIQQKIRPRLLVDVDPHYPKKEAVSAFKATRLLGMHVRQCFYKPFGNLGINGSAGIGKSRSCIGNIARLKPGDKLIEYYAPTHELGEELRLEIVEQLQKTGNPLRVQAIAGRTHQDRHGSPLCERHHLVAKVSRAGLSVYNTLCQKSEDNRCPHFENCRYLKQFRSKADVRILTHAHLALPRTSLDAGMPDLAIIDESFFQSMLDIQTYPLDRLVGSHLPAKLKRTIHHALLYKEPLFAALETEFSCTLEAELREALDSFRNKGLLQLEPKMSDAQLERSLGKHYNYSLERRLLTALHKEYEFITTESLNSTLNRRRTESHTVRVYGNSKFSICQRKELTRFTTQIGDKAVTCPVLYLDANLESRIAGLFLKNLRVETIEAERKARVIQCYSTRNAKNRFVCSEMDSDDKQQNIERHIENTRRMILKYWSNDRSKRLLVIGYKDIINGILKVKPKKSLATAGGPGYLEYQHFGNLRGKDIYKNFDVCALVGRLQPAPHDLENMAAALWWDSDIPLTLTGELVDQQRGYRMRNNAKFGAWVSVHPDSRVQMLLEQVRESEILQGIDRLRLIHTDQEKLILILTSLPLPIEVDELISYRDLTKGNKIHSLLESPHQGVIPLSPSYLSDQYADIFTSLESAKQTVKRFKDEYPDGKYSYGNRLYVMIAYRVRGEAGGNKTALADSSLGYKKIRRELQKLHSADISLLSNE